ncbi:MAG: four helix bundle protein, partial [Bacteroidales bacterium]|nr:four helix bundle protein [Bacteroidales bacterium]
MNGWMGCLLAAVLAGANGTAGSGPLERSGKDGAVPVGRMSVGPMSWREAALMLLGVSQWEELDEEVAERLEDLLAHPLPLNTASLTAMQESGLLSFYQCAVIEEWRARNGDILSFEELAVFQKARALCKEIYEVTNIDPFASDYRFVQQIRAATGSIKDNIAE